MDSNPESIWMEFTGPNAAYLEDLYERFRADPEAVDPATREFFDRFDGFPTPVAAPVVGREAAAPAPDVTKVAAAVALATAIRAYGHRAAHLDPLGGEPPGDAALIAETHGIHEEDLAWLPASIVGGPAATQAGNALAAIRALRRVYQGTAGYEFEHITDAAERAWLRDAVESGRFRPPRDPIDECILLERLTEVASFERFLHLAFPGQTRFSLEGLGMIVPILDEIIGAAAETGTRSVLLGMAHRGRLNVLAHVLGKPYQQIIAEFLGRYRRSGVSRSGSSDFGWTGDVKYHLGARKAYRGGPEVDMQVLLAPNPSHLEWVNPVVVGMDRALDERRDAPGPARQDELTSMSVLIHGDGSFVGQGIVAETLNLSRLPGYRIGGTIHIIANNQVGFTTNPSSARSTLYASDLAAGFEIPVIHVNADDVEACIAAARLAHAYRERFRKDVLIDLIGYRRWGHNEGDEPSFTQPLYYAQVAKHPTVRELWAAELERRGLVTHEAAQAMLQGAIENLHAIREQLLEETHPHPEEQHEAESSGLEAGHGVAGLGRAGAAAEVRTTVPRESLARLNAELYHVPPRFNLHPKLERPFARRREFFLRAGAEDGGGAGEQVEWAHAEALAFASILSEGTPIRLTGQDTARGTFSQRHAVLYDAKTGAAFTPLQEIPSARASFEVWDSPLSEQATLGFEFGYTLQAQEALVLWEAQYGDFVNSAQVIIDQFLASARSKWEQHSGLVLLLPHGYEGQGPEHSSARLERFLQLAAEDNLLIANCTTAAQYFHILRRQAQLLSLAPRPLVLLTPKSLLRHPLAASPASELYQAEFQPVLDDAHRAGRPEEVRRLVFCTGKVYFDLVAARQPSPEGNGQPRGADVAAIRIEELYPFPAECVARLLEAYPNAEEVVWLQEEPRNMGAWSFVAPRLRDLLRGHQALRYVGRTWRSSPSEGSYQWHVKEQTRLVEAALDFEPGVPEGPAEREVEHAV